MLKPRRGRRLFRAGTLKSADTLASCWLSPPSEELSKDICIFSSSLYSSFRFWARCCWTTRLLFGLRLSAVSATEISLTLLFLLPKPILVFDKGFFFVSSSPLLPLPAPPPPPNLPKIPDSRALPPPTALSFFSSDDSDPDPELELPLSFLNLSLTVLVVKCNLRFSEFSLIFSHSGFVRLRLAADVTTRNCFKIVEISISSFSFMYPRVKMRSLVVSLQQPKRQHLGRQSFKLRMSVVKKF